MGRGPGTPWAPRWRWIICQSMMRHDSAEPAGFELSKKDTWYPTALWWIRDLRERRELVTGDKTRPATGDVTGQQTLVPAALGEETSVQLDENTLVPAPLVSRHAGRTSRSPSLFESVHYGLLALFFCQTDGQINLSATAGLFIKG